MRRSPILTLACAMLAALAITISTAAAQTATGQITGTVRDASGGVMSGVKVVISNQQTGLTRETKTGSNGDIAARRLGAEQIIMLGRHTDRIALARRFGATDVVSERGDGAIERVRELTGGLGAHSVLECVGHGESMRTAVGIARAGGAVGRVGVPQETTIPNAQPTFYANVTIAGGPAPVRAYMQELLPDVLEGRIEPGLVFDRVTNIDGVPDGYRAMNAREAIKVMIEF